MDLYAKFDRDLCGIPINYCLVKTENESNEIIRLEGPMGKPCRAFTEDGIFGFPPLMRGFYKIKENWDGTYKQNESLYSYFYSSDFKPLDDKEFVVRKEEDRWVLEPLNLDHLNKCIFEAYY